MVRVTHGHIKICGLRRPEEYVAAAEAGATAVGFVFFAKSPRDIAPAAVRDIIERADAGLGDDVVRPWHVGVFVEPSPELLSEAIDAGLSHVQPHGAISPEAAQVIADRGVGLLRPIGVRSRLSSADLAPPTRPYPPPVAWLCDTFDPTEHGGTGRQFRHDDIQDILPTHPIWVAGGLAPDNVGDVIAALPGIVGVDVSSGVEFPADEVGERGVKDVERIRAFVAAARAAFEAQRR